MDAPDVRGREGILRVHAKKLPLADDVELSLIARGTPGMSGADLANICNEAALLAARRAADKVTMDDFEQAKDKVMLGTERRSLVLTERERKLTAYHEAGHAVIGLRIPGLDPVHKVTIVPRGRALGITASLPEEDRHSYTKDWLEGQLAMLFGGRVAEEMIFGEHAVTTGAGNDIERATNMARRMVTTFGMSDVIGLVAVDDGEHEVFLGRDFSQRRQVSEHTARIVDQEVKRIIDEAHKKAHEVLEEHGDLLEAIAQALLERETLDRNRARDARTRRDAASDARARGRAPGTTAEGFQGRQGEEPSGVRTPRWGRPATRSCAGRGGRLRGRRGVTVGSPCPAAR